MDFAKKAVADLEVNVNNENVRRQLSSSPFIIHCTKADLIVLFLIGMISTSIFAKTVLLVGNGKQSGQLETDLIHYRLQMLRTVVYYLYCLQSYFKYASMLSALE